MAKGRKRGKREQQVEEHEAAADERETDSRDGQPTCPELEEQLAASREDADSCRDRLMRLQAEFENYKKRQARDREDQRRSARSGILKEFLPILDNLARAVEHAEGTAAGQVVEGVELVLKQLRESFTQLGVTRIESLGQAFDPHIHEAMSRVETDGDPPDGTVVEVYQQGYLLDGKVLRPAMVGVAKIVDEVGEEAGD